MNHGEEDYYVEKIYEDTILYVLLPGNLKC